MTLAQFQNYLTVFFIGAAFDAWTAGQVYRWASRP